MLKTDAAPWIGLPAQMDPGTDRQYLGCQYTDAVLSAGGIPLIIPLSANAESVAALAERLDGIILTGNDSDMDPALYNAPRLDVCGRTQPLRDRTDFLLLEAAFKRKIPVLAICFGIQSLNVFLQGTLIQDIASLVGTSVRHSNSNSEVFTSHKVEIVSGSVLEQVAGGLEVAVNSSHHQAIGRPGRGLEIIAQAADGIVEAVSHTNDNPWILGVQWHPEKSFARDDFSRKLFGLFLARCRAARGCDEGTHS